MGAERACSDPHEGGHSSKDEKDAFHPDCMLVFICNRRFPAYHLIHVTIKDDAGNEFICPIDALKDRGSATDEELQNCVDDAVAGRYAGNIDIAD